MRKALSILALACALPLAVQAAALDGKWLAKIERKDAAKGAVTLEFTLELKVDGDKLTGTVTGGAGRRPLTMTIENGKVEGDRFSFTTVQKGRKGDQKFLWEGTIAGDELKGTRTTEGRRRGLPFSAKRAS